MWKRFGGVDVVKDVSLVLQPGEVHGLIGENGAGKSKLIKMIGGIYRPDGGTVEIAGEAVQLASPADAARHGIAIVHQELAVFPDLDAAENVFMGRMPTRAGGLLDRPAMARGVRAALDRLGVRLDLDTPVGRLSIGQRQLIEIAKGITTGARIIVMDEPTAALTPVEARDLFQVIRSLADDGVAILFVSHRLDELFSICARLTILRDGETVHEAAVGDLSEEEVVRHMVGRRLSALYPPLPEPSGDVALAVSDLRRDGAFSGVGFGIRAGEILGFAGLVGAGRSEIARAVFGIDRLDAGTISIAGRPVRIDEVDDALRAGIAYLPEDRHGQGILLEADLARNATLAIVARLASHFGHVSRSAETAVAGDYARRLDIRMRSLRDLAASLSGGNQQKVVLAKWLATRPRILIVDEPTRGVDVGAKAEVHRILAELAGAGMAILMISSNLPELLGMSHRIMVVREGRIVGEFPREAFDQEAIMASATGTASRTARAAQDAAATVRHGEGRLRRVSYGRIPSIVATLGSLYAVRGLLALPLMAGGGNEIGTAGMSPGYLALGDSGFAGIPAIALFAAAAVAVSAVYLRALPWGRAVYAVGSNPSAARLVGLPVRGIVLGAFVVSGIAAGVAGFLGGARFGYVGPDNGAGLELASIAAAVVGGVAILGGSGGPLGAALGALLLGMIANALAILAIPGTYLEAITGVAILAAIVIQFAIRGRGLLRGAGKPAGVAP